MYGRYARDLASAARSEGKRLKRLEKRRKKDDRARQKELSSTNSGKFARAIGSI